MSCRTEKRYQIIVGNDHGGMHVRNMARFRNVPKRLLTLSYDIERPTGSGYSMAPTKALLIDYVSSFVDVTCHEIFRWIFPVGCTMMTMQYYDKSFSQFWRCNDLVILCISYISFDCHFRPYCALCWSLTEF
jgi:hypothetical protein